MGAKESKSCCITYEEALKRVNKQEFKRLEDAFKQELLKRSSLSVNGSGAVIPKSSFIKEVLGDYVPTPIAECIYVACGGTSRGIGFKELLCGLVVFTRGKFEEKCQFLFNIYSNESGNYIIKNELYKFLRETEPTESRNSFDTLFDVSDKVTYEEFFEWLNCNYEATSLSRWLLSKSCSVSLNNELEMLTFYQTLAGVTHLEETDIIDLEKLYWVLKKHSKTGKLDLETLVPLISPPVPLNICESFFNVFDENRDGHIDFKEMACGISAACRGPLTERQKFCFKIFDIDRDGVLSDSEIENMIDVLLFVYHENSVVKIFIDKEVILQDIYSHRHGEYLTIEEYVIWTVHNNLSMDFLNLIFQVCHIVLGLKPISRQEEGSIVKGWMQREERRGYISGQFWYLVSYDWWSMWENYVTSPTKSFSSNNGSLSMDYKNDHSKLNGRAYSMPFLSSSSNSSLSSHVNLTYATQRGSPGRPGSIDNCNLIVSASNKVLSLTGEGGKLKSNLIRGQDYELVPDSLWKALLRWYGGSLSLARQVIEPCDNTVELELYPLTLRILKHQTQTNTTRPTYNQTGSWSGMVGGYGAAALRTSSYSYVTNVNTTPKRYLAYTATFSRMATIKNVYNFICENLRLRPEDIRLWHFYENNMLAIEDEDLSLELLGACDDDQILLEIRNKDLTWPEEISSLGLNNNDKNKRATERGATGLNNLGNTCFMNAALQCVSNTQALTLYFINSMHLYELNRTNPLGMKGHIAKRYGDLIHDIWSGTSRTIAPLKLRWTIGKYAPRFNGFQQHDSQELLAFLLDGLHEDLNRVHDKPYLELKDSECRPDVAVAQEAWENHILRNKSIIVDLFHGQLKSKVICKSCGHESVRFDPFNYLSLPLPMESYVYVQVAVIKLNGSIPTKYTLRLNADEKYLNLKQQLMQRCGIPVYLIKLCEVASSQIKNTLPDDQKVKSTNNNNILFAYELPTLCGGSGSISADEERLSITSIKSSHREAAQTFTAIQRSVRPGSQTNLGITCGSQNRTISEESSDSAINSASSSGSSSGGGDICCSETTADNNSPAGDCSEILLEDMSTQLTVDSGHCSASSASLADSTDTNNSASQPPPYIIAVHRKLVRQDVYFVSTQKSKPSLFGLPLIVPCNENTTHCELYQSVWLQVARFVSPLPPYEVITLNHAMDCDDSLGYEFPFLLKAVNKDGTQCAWCPWYRFCRGCQIQCCDAEFCFSSSYIAIDWDPTALHLRYLTSQENKYECVGDNNKMLQSEPIDLASCLEAFTTEEHLADDEKYYCSKCKQHQPASKKLQIWRLPPVLIIHLKRFQYLQGKWVKSQKVVKFPFKEFDLTDYLAAVPRETIRRYQVLHNRHNKKHKDTNTIAQNGDNLSTILNGCSLTDEEDNSNITEFISKSSGENIDVNINEADDVCENPSTNDYNMAQKRKRLESTSLTRTPIDDAALQDFHQHRLQDNVNPFKLKYNVYAIVCHSGILGGGHYISYASNPNGKWYCYNDSSCREVNTDMDTSCAYMLFYEREGLAHEMYMPNVSGKKPIDVNDLDQDFENDYKKMCHLM